MPDDQPRTHLGNRFGRGPESEPLAELGVQVSLSDVTRLDEHLPRTQLVRGPERASPLDGIGRQVPGDGLIHPPKVHTQSV